MAEAAEFEEGCLVWTEAFPETMRCWGMCICVCARTLGSKRRLCGWGRITLLSARPGPKG